MKNGRMVKEGVPGSAQRISIGSSKVGGAKKGMGMGKAGPLVTTTAKNATLMKRK